MTILEIRLKLGLSQQEFCNKFHIHPKTLQSWEQGWRNPQAHTVFLIQRVVELEAQLARR